MPNSRMSASMVSTSVTSGTFVSSSGSGLSSAAAICGRTAFFAPQIWTEPSMRLPPRMTSRSIMFLFVARNDQQTRAGLSLFNVGVP